VPFLLFSRRRGLARQKAESELETYWSKVRATMEGRPIKVLAAYGPHVTLKGPEVEGIVVSEFPSIEEARAWCDSAFYCCSRTATASGLPSPGPRR
jgi:uncharacterized protein (DUF1330 family)